MALQGHQVAPRRADLADDQHAANRRQVHVRGDRGPAEKDVLSSIGRGSFQNQARCGHAKREQAFADEFSLGLGLITRLPARDQQALEHAFAPQRMRRLAEFRHPMARPEQEAEVGRLRREGGHHVVADVLEGVAGHGWERKLRMGDLSNK